MLEGHFCENAPLLRWSQAPTQARTFSLAAASVGTTTRCFCVRRTHENDLHLRQQTGFCQSVQDDAISRNQCNREDRRLLGFTCLDQAVLQLLLQVGQTSGFRGFVQLNVELGATVVSEFRDLREITRIWGEECLARPSVGQSNAMYKNRTLWQRPAHTCATSENLHLKEDTT